MCEADPGSSWAWSHRRAWQEDHSPADLPHGALSQSWEQLLASQVQSHHQVFIKLPLCARELERDGARAEFISISIGSSPASPSPLSLWPAAPWVGKGKSRSQAYTHACTHTEIHAFRNMHVHRCAYTGPQIYTGPRTWTRTHSGASKTAPLNGEQEMARSGRGRAPLNSARRTLCTPSLTSSTLIGPDDREVNITDAPPQKPE